jgi:hypothetical protein
LFLKYETSHKWKLQHTTHWECVILWFRYGKQEYWCSYQILSLVELWIHSWVIIQFWIMILLWFITFISFHIDKLIQPLIIRVKCMQK